MVWLLNPNTARASFLAVDSILCSNFKQQTDISRLCSLESQQWFRLECLGYFPKPRIHHSAVVKDHKMVIYGMTLPCSCVFGASILSAHCVVIFSHSSLLLSRRDCVYWTKPPPPGGCQLQTTLFPFFLMFCLSGQLPHLAFVTTHWAWRGEGCAPKPALALANSA